MISQIKYFLEYVGYLLLSFIVRIIPRRVLYNISYFLSYINYFILKIRIDVVLNNLIIAFGGQCEFCNKSFLIRYFTNQIFCFMDYINAVNIPNERVLNLVKEVQLKGNFSKNGIFISGHFSNFMLLFRYINYKLFPLAAINKRQKNIKVNNDFYGKLTSKYNVPIYDMKRDLKKILRHDFSKYSLGILIDQDAGKKGVMVNFLGREASTYKGAAFLVKKYKLPVYFSHIRLNNDLTYSIYIEELKINFDDSEESILECFNQKLSDFIRLYPFDWFWVHKRWKTQRSKS